MAVKYMVADTENTDHKTQKEKPIQNRNIDSKTEAQEPESQNTK